MMKGLSAAILRLSFPLLSAAMIPTLARSEPVLVLTCCMDTTHAQHVQYYHDNVAIIRF